jgi:hypothetical protein
LEELPSSAAPRPLNEIVLDIVQDHPEWQCDPIEKAVAWSPTVEKLLGRHWEESLSRGRLPRFAFNSSSPYMIQGVCFVEPCDSVEVQEQKRKRLHWQEYYNALRELDPRQFEVLCSKVLGLLGVPNPRLTAYQADEGIDFYGRLSIGDLVGHGAAFQTFEARLIIWLVGQAKHYLHTKVATPDIRELVGATTLGKARAFVKDEKHPDLKIRVCDPVVMLFFTTGQISIDGWTLCDRTGVAAMDGEMLAAFLADKGVGVHADGDEDIYDPDSFAAWLDND